MSPMKERKGAVTFKGAPLTLVGEPIEVGKQAPDVALLDNAMQPVKLGSFRGKVLVLLSVPSLDTSVCDTEARRFNQEAAALGQDVAVVAVSCDLPPAQKRWCGAAGVERVTTLSDHRETAFGLAYGVLVKELRLLARCLWVIDRQGVVKYVQLVREIASEPDYTPVMSAVKDCV
jgi:thiol peroxidase